MKKWSILSAFALLAALSTGCSSAYYASSSASGYAGDDLYVTHDKTEIARRQQQAAEARKAEAEARRAEWEARLAEAQALAAENRYNSTLSGGQNYSYTSVLADTYESAYARRLRGFESLSYRMPSSYYNFRYGNAFSYVSAYDPAFYNIVISGDEVWVEPKYITSMFGTWGATVYNTGWYDRWSWNFGWSYMPRWWGYSPWGWNWGFAWHPWHAPVYRPSAWRPGWGMAWGPGIGGGWGYRPAHNYRLDSYPRPGNAGYLQPAPAGSRSGSAGSVNSGRRGSSYNTNGRTGGSYNNNGNRNNGSYNSSTPSRSGSSNSNSSNSNWNNGSSGRSGSYNNGGSRSGGGGYSGGSGSSSGGGRSSGGGYNRGR